MAIRVTIPEKIIPSAIDDWISDTLFISRSAKEITATYIRRSDPEQRIALTRTGDDFNRIAVALGLVDVKDKLESHALDEGFLDGTIVPD